MRGQPAFWELDDRYERLSAVGNPTEPARHFNLTPQAGNEGLAFPRAELCIHPSRFLSSLD